MESPETWKKTSVSRFARTVIVDTGFWYALFDERDQYHQDACDKEALLEQFEVIMPWPCVYETLNTRFMRRDVVVRRFEALVRRPQVVLLGDEKYREDALRIALQERAGRGPEERRTLSLVDIIIRLILDDNAVRKHGLLTFNDRDFDDLCRKHGIEMLRYT